MTEIWKPVPSAPNYEASSLGRIRRATAGKRTRIGRILKPTLKMGYWKVIVTHNNQQTTRGVHRLVCEAFYGLPPEGTEAAHNDGDKNNNVLGNIRWATSSENKRDMIAHGTAPTGEKAPHAKLTASDVIEIRAAFANGASPQVLASLYNVHYSNIHVIVKRKSWKHV